MFENHDDILTVEQLMDILYIGKNTAYELLSSGAIAGFKIGRVWRIPREAVSNFIMSQSKKRYS